MDIEDIVNSSFINNDSSSNRIFQQLAFDDPIFMISEVKSLIYTEILYFNNIESSSSIKIHSLDNTNALFIFKQFYSEEIGYYWGFHFCYLTNNLLYNTKKELCKNVL